MALCCLDFHREGYAIYIDGTKKYDTNNHASISSGKTRAVSVGDFDYSNMIDLLSSATYIYLGYGSDTETAEAYYDDLKIWTNTFSDSDAQGPNIGSGIHVPDPVYKATFETTTGLQIIGGGSFVTDDNSAFGTVFKNIPGGMRQNYLLLPEDVNVTFCRNEGNVYRYVGECEGCRNLIHLYVVTIIQCSRAGTGHSRYCQYRQLAYVCIVCKRNITTE